MPYKDKQKQKEYLKNYHKINRNIYHDKLGTTDFDEHMETKQNGEPDFDKEYREIQNEMKKLKLKKIQ